MRRTLGPFIGMCSAFFHQDSGKYSFDYPLAHQFYDSLWHSASKRWYLCGPYGTMDNILHDTAVQLLKGQITVDQAREKSIRFLPPPAPYR